MIKICFVNASTVVTDAELTACVAALQIQVTRDFAPYYGITAQLSSGETVPTDWQIIFGDDSDVLEAMGYHELTAAGQPLGKVFAKTDKQCGANWTVTASHELLEMLADPWACMCAQGRDGLMRAFEVADAVEDDQFSYEINGVKVSDFVLPSWFNGTPSPYDFLRRLTAPGQLLTGGYISIFQNGSWAQVQADKSPLPAARIAIRPGSRRSKRMAGRSAWKLSELKAA